jgi:integrase/recombinase XerD
VPGNRLTPFKAKELFREYLKEAGYSETTIKGRLSYLRILFTYLPNRKDLRDVRPEDIRNFIGCLSRATSKVTGNPYSPKTIEMIVSSVRLFFRCLYVKERILINPTRVISLTVPSVGSTKEIFSEAEISCFLDSIDLSSYQGKRDRAIFELMYSSGP